MPCAVGLPSFAVRDRLRRGLCVRLELLELLARGAQLAAQLLYRLPHHLEIRAGPPRLLLDPRQQLTSMLQLLARPVELVSCRDQLRLQRLLRLPLGGECARRVRRVRPRALELILGVRELLQHLAQLTVRELDVLLSWGLL